MRGCLWNGRGTKGSVQSPVVFIPGSLKTTRNLRSKQLIVTVEFLHVKGICSVHVKTSFQQNIFPESEGREGRSAFRNISINEQSPTSAGSRLVRQRYGRS